MNMLREAPPSRKLVALMAMSSAFIASMTLGAVATAQVTTCESLISLALPDTTITNAQSLPAGAFVLPTGQQLANLPESCRVTGTIKPTTDSNILFEVWLPISG
jgi:hypothetical protein